jgi:hypothetical protein
MKKILKKFILLIAVLFLAAVLIIGWAISKNPDGAREITNQLLLLFSQR